jgi:Domain of unknown function (DUF4340)
MNRQRLSILLVAALLVLGLALFLSTRRNAGSELTQSGPLLPGFNAQSEGLSTLSIRKGSGTPQVTLKRSGDQWAVLQRNDYPADVSRLRKLILALNDAKIIEAKTKEPANFAIIGVEDATQPAAAGTEIDYTIKDGAHSLIIGKPVGEGNFVRRVGDNQSYQVSPGIYVESEPRSWIDNKLFELPIGSIQKVDVKLAGGPSYSLHRVAAPPAPKTPPAASAASAAPEPPAESPFVLEGVPAGRKAADAATLAPSVSALSGLTADDVGQASDVDFSKPSTAIFTMKDGGIVTVTGTVVGDKHWITVSGIKDAAFAEKSKGRAYELAGYRYEGIFRSLDQLLVPKEAPPEAKKAGNGSTAPKPKKPPSTP